MANFLFWSDLHLELSSEKTPIDFPRPTANCNADHVDAILVAGDLSAAGRSMDRLVEIQEAWGVPVVFLPGNHDFWHMDLESYPARLKREAMEWRAQGREIHVLDCDEIEIAGTRILGATLWTDFAITGDAEQAKLRLSMAMRDFRKIFARPDGEFATPDDLIAVHQRHLAWITDRLAEKDGRPVVVMSHHVPVPEMIRAEGRADGFAAGYVSDLREKILSHHIDAWICGHSHAGHSGWIEGAQNRIAFLTNMMGYAREAGTTGFEPYRILDSANPRAGLDEIRVTATHLRHLPPADYFTDPQPDPWA